MKIESQAEIVSNFSLTNERGSERKGRIAPVSHGLAAPSKNTVLIGILAASSILFALGAVLWAAGAHQTHPSLLISGKVFFGIGIAPIVLFGCFMGCLFFIKYHCGASQAEKE